MNYFCKFRSYELFSVYNIITFTTFKISTLLTYLSTTLTISFLRFPIFL